MLSTIEIKGTASGKSIKKIIIKEEDWKKSLLEFLLENNIPVASSCFGEGACKRCLVNESILSCQITLKKFCELYPNQILTISYL